MLINFVEVDDNLERVLKWPHGIVRQVTVRRLTLTSYRNINPVDSRQGEAESGIEWVYGR